MKSPWAWLWHCTFASVWFCYAYVGLVLLRELAQSFPQTVYDPMRTYAPYLALLVDWMRQRSYRFVEYWCWLEGAFYIALKLQIRWLQTKDPLEASLSSAPLMDTEDRQTLWRRIMGCERDDPATFVSGWFFDVPITKISRYDVRDFLTWCMYEGRHQEHLTTTELEQLESFVEDLEYRISLQLYGTIKTDDNNAVAANGEERRRDDGSEPPPAVAAAAAAAGTGVIAENGRVGHRNGDDENRAVLHNATSTTLTKQQHRPSSLGDDDDGEEAAAATREEKPEPTTVSVTTIFDDDVRVAVVDNNNDNKDKTSGNSSSRDDKEEEDPLSFRTVKEQGLPPPNKGKCMLWSR